MKKEVPPEKEKVLKAAASLFAEKGYAGATVRDIAERINVSVAMLYYYFKSKEEVIFSISEMNGDSLLRILDDAIRDNSDPLGRLRQMMFVYICSIPANKNEVKIFVEQHCNLSRKYKNKIVKRHRKIYDIYMGELRQLKNLALIRFDDLSVVVFAMFGMVNWTYRWYREGDKKPIEGVARILIDLFFHGILTDAGLALYSKLDPI